MQRQYITKNSNNNSSTNTEKSTLARTAITQIGTNTNAPLTQQDIENQQYQQDRFEATKLEIQAKYGTITPVGQERLNLLQAKKAEFWQRYLAPVRRYNQDFANIPLTRAQAKAKSKKAIQAKLTIGAPGDKYEQEADRVAAQVVNQINAPVSQQPIQNLQREVVSEKDELQMKSADNIQREDMPEEELQMKPILQLQAGDGGVTATQELESSIQQARSSGQPLANNVRRPMEQAFGTDFNGVKIHTDTQADQLNQSIQARAFTTGHDLFFRQGEYNPGSRRGQELIAHELTHVVQQKANTGQYVVEGTERSGSNGQIQRMMMSPDTIQQSKKTPEKSKDNPPNMIETILEKIATQKGFSLQELEMRTYSPSGVLLAYRWDLDDEEVEKSAEEIYKFIKQDPRFATVCGHTSRMSFPPIEDNKSEEKGKDTENLIQLLKTGYEGLVRVDSQGHSFTIEATQTSMRIYQSNLGQYSLAERINKDRVYSRQDFINNLEDALRTNDNNNQNKQELFGKVDNFKNVVYQYKRQSYEANLNMVSENIQKDLKEHDEVWNRVQNSKKSFKDYVDTLE